MPKISSGYQLYRSIRLPIIREEQKALGNSTVLGRLTGIVAAEWSNDLTQAQRDEYNQQAKRLEQIGGGGPSSPYQLYRSIRLPVLKAERLAHGKSVTLGVMTQIIAQEWVDMSPSEKAKYNM